MKNNIITNSFVAISDFHSYKWPLKKIKDYYLNEYETIYILGDATDRGEELDGTGGLEILCEIKRLTEKYPDRVVYIPGNHDQFLYDYVYNKYFDVRNLECNGGKQTKADIDYMKKNEPEKLHDLMDWLGNQPLQRTRVYNGKKYALAHAFFNQNIYNQFPNLALKDINSFSLKEERDVINNILWFRKSKNTYDMRDLPSSNVITVIGHTPLRSRKDESLDLINRKGETIKVHCVDGGIAFNGDMLKYDGGVRSIKTTPIKHDDTSPTIYWDDKTVPIKLNMRKDQKDELTKAIVCTLINTKSRETAYDLIESFFLTGNSDFLKNDGSYEPRNLVRRNVLEEELKDFAMEKYEEEDIEKERLIYEYVNELVFCYIYECLEKRFGSIDTAINQINAFLNEKKYSYITNSIGKARNVAIKVGVDSLRDVIGSSSVKEHLMGIYGLSILIGDLKKL